MHALKIYHFCQMNLSPSFPGVVEGMGLRECLPSWLVGEGSSGLLQQQVEAVQDTLASLTREEVQAEFLKVQSVM